MKIDKYKWARTSLLILLGIRVFGNMYGGIVAVNDMVMFVCVVIAAIYFTALAGIYGNKRWGSYLVIALGIVDILITATFMVGGIALGIVMYDVVILALGTFEKIPLKTGLGGMNDGSKKIIRDGSSG